MIRSTLRPGHDARPGRPRLLPLLVVTTVLLVSGCGLVGNPDRPKTAPERNSITVGAMPAIDVAPLHLAIRNGYFAAAGLDVRLHPIQGGAAGLPLLTSGELDITFGNWVSSLQAQQTGQADLKVVSDGYQANPGMFLLLAMPGQGLTKVEDLKGRKIAVNARKNISELTTLATLRMYGLSESDVEFVVMPFEEMAEALESGRVDAASTIEPYTSMANQLGATTLADTATGSTADIPIAGYVTTSAFAHRYPRTVAAFHRVMARAQAEASADRVQVEALLPSYANIDPKTAALVRIGVYPATVEPGRLQRVADLMRAHGTLSGDLDVSRLLLPGDAR